jgi:alkylhydroperoxidase family enzyme
LTAEDWAALKAGDYSRYSPKESAALNYVEKLTLSPHAIGDADFAPLRRDFSEPEIVDIHLLAGLVNLTNRFTDPLGLEVEFPEQSI